MLCQVANGAQVENKMNLPVPVYLRPLDQKDASMKVQLSHAGKTLRLIVGLRALKIVDKLIRVLCSSCGALQVSICLGEGAQPHQSSPSRSRVLRAAWTS